MAVPTSGALSMKDIAQEALHGTWGTGTINDPISLYDLVNGGQVKGSGDDYPAVNQNCLPNPANRTTTYRAFTIGASGGGTTTLYSKNTPYASIAIGTIIYSNATGTVYTGGGGFIAGPSSVAWFGGNCACPAFNSNTSTGAITSTGCGCP